MATRILMPALSPTMTEGTLSAWLVEEGQTVASGDIIAEIETDKATMEVEAVEEGVVAKLLVEPGTEGVAVNAVIAVLIEDGEDYDVEVDHEPDQAIDKDRDTIDRMKDDKSPQLDHATTHSIDLSRSEQSTQHRVKASPLAKRIARQNGIDLNQFDGSGPNGRIIKRDVESYQAGSTSTGGAGVNVGITPTIGVDGPTPFEIEKPSAIRKIIASRLSESKFTSPHFYVTVDMEIDSLLELRKQINANPDEPKVSVNDIILMACGRALKAIPGANKAWVGDEIHQYTRADISVAVASERGLVTPVIKGADTQSLRQISAVASKLVTKARDGKLLPEEMQGGSFSISNMGMMGVKHFTSIINPPQGAILAVGAGEKRPVVKNDELAVATVMTCTLSADHRVIDGAVAAELIGKIKGLIENPIQMLV
ncbi:MAG: pyruvate dehydrogenase complex dihydrolipoamide acetyltransferase [Alphaproteobacteria bacterium]